MPEAANDGCRSGPAHILSNWSTDRFCTGLGLRNASISGRRQLRTGTKGFIMSSERRIRASHANGALSRPVTPEGKARSALDTDLVEQLVAARWRTQRSWGLETDLLDLEMLKQEDQIAQEFKSHEDRVRPPVGKQFVKAVFGMHIDAAARRNWRLAAQYRCCPAAVVAPIEQAV